MGQRSNYASEKDAQIRHRREECAGGMGQKQYTKGAALKNALIKLKQEECASSMGQKPNYAALVTAQIMHGREMFAGGMGQK